MNAPTLKRCLPLILLGTLPTLAPAQKQDATDDVRDAFIYTRAKVPAGKQNETAKVNRAKGRKQAKSSSIGLGYTVYQRGEDGKLVRVSSSQEFRQGDAVRLIVESNVDGYLYIFHTENDGPPRMIFPDARLNDGRNNITAHVPYEAPSSREPDPKRRWFVFDERPATERLYLVITKKPLPGTPIGGELVAYCQANAGACPWRPAQPAWTQIAANAGAAREDKKADSSQLLTSVEREAIERGLGLELDAPAPSVIRMSKSPQARQLTTMIALIHK